MRIVLVNSLYHPHERGGAECAVRLLAEGLRERGLDVSVVCLSPESQEVRDEVSGVPVIRIPLANVYWPFGGRQKSIRNTRRVLWHLADSYNPIMGVRLGKVLDEARPDIVHLNNLAGFSIAAVIAAKRRSLATVQTLHDYYYVCPRTTTFQGGHNCERPCGACRVYAAVRKRIGRRVDLVCGVSEAMLTRLEEFGAFRGVAQRAVVHGANLPGTTAEACRTDHGQGDPLKVGFLGRLDPTKGLETLLSAVEMLRNEPLEAVIAGHGAPEYVAKLHARAEGLPVRFLGHVQPERFLAEIDVLVVPSVWHEPFGRVVQEAFSCGVPVVASAIGGIPEAIGAGGPGFLFPPGSSARLAEILAGFVKKGFPAEQFFGRAVLRSRDFTADRIVSEHLALYQRVLKSAKRFHAAEAFLPSRPSGIDSSRRWS